MSGSNVEIVDDRDPRVKYSDGWVLSGTSHEFGGTTHGTFTGGSKATFTFNGSSVEVYGTMGIDHTDPPISSYSLDGSPPQTFSPPLPDAIQYQQLFYKSSALNDTQHVLVVTSTVTESVFWLDYFRIASNEIITPLPNPVSSSTPTVQSSSLSMPIGPSQTSANSPAPPANRALIGAIVGGVVGGVAFVLLSCIFVLYYRRKIRSCGSTTQSQRSSLEAHSLPFSTDQERGTTSLLGEVSPFTVHQTNINAHHSERIGFASEPITPPDAESSYAVAASGKSERSRGPSEDLHDQDLPPPQYYS